MSARVVYRGPSSSGYCWRNRRFCVDFLLRGSTERSRCHVVAPCPDRACSRRDRPGRSSRVPKGLSGHAPARRAGCSLRRPDVRLSLPGPWPAGALPVAPGPRHGAAVRRRAERPAGGRRGPGADRLKVCAGPGAPDPGFDFSVLCEFRARLVAGRLEQNLLDAMLAQLRERGLLKARGRQRTDSTHVLAAVRAVNRLESVGETLRAALNALAAAAPEWLARHADAEWADRYGRRFEEWRPPKGEGPRKTLGEAIGADGHRLL